MTSVVNVFQFVLPALVVSIAVILLCFYLHLRKKRATYDVTVPLQHDNVSPALHTIPLPADQAEVDAHYDRFPPRYSTVDQPPPYSMFDPKLTSVWPGSPPPAYEMYPIMLPLAPRLWMTPTRALQPTPPTSPVNRNHPYPQRSRRASSS